MPPGPTCWQAPDPPVSAAIPVTASAAPSAPSPRPLGVALVGLGFGEKVHLPALLDCPLTEPVALWHHRPDRLEQARAATGLPGFERFEALLEAVAADAAERRGGVSGGGRR